MAEGILNNVISIIWKIIDIISEVVTSNTAIEIWLLILGAIISVIISYIIKDKRDQLVILSSLLSEIEGNRQRATKTAVNIYHDIQSRTSGDSRYTWSTGEFSTSAYNQLRTQGVNDKISSDLRKRLKEHYEEIQDNNQSLQERETEQLDDGPVNLDELPNARDAGMVLDILMLCSKDHGREIRKSENNDGAQLEDDPRMRLLFDRAYSIEDNMMALESIMQNNEASQSLEDIINKNLIWQFEKNRPIQSEYEKFSEMKRFRDEYNFDTVKDSLENEINSYNPILRKLFL